MEAYVSLLEENSTLVGCHDTKSSCSNFPSEQFLFADPVKLLNQKVLAWYPDTPRVEKNNIGIPILLANLTFNTINLQGPKSHENNLPHTFGALAASHCASSLGVVPAVSPSNNMDELNHFNIFWVVPLPSNSENVYTCNFQRVP